jgi:hypothetical protein
MASWTGLSDNSIQAINGSLCLQREWNSFSASSGETKRRKVGSHSTTDTKQQMQNNVRTTPRNLLPDFSQTKNTDKIDENSHMTPLFNEEWMNLDKTMHYNLFYCQSL